MGVDKKIIGRFQELENRADQLLQTKTSKGGETGYILNSRVTNPTYYSLNPELAIQWGANCLHLLKQVFSQENDYYIEFKRLFSDFSESANFEAIKQALGILKAGRDDVEHGYLFDTHVLIEAEVFDDFLEQAEHLLKNGYHGPAAVVVGSVLEDGLRKLCQRNNVSLPAKPTIDPMNIELVKASVYNTLTQKRITPLADIRNKAAHGKWNEFNDKDVEQMISQVRSFMEDYFG
ncbi:MAG: hypothetical protein QOH49_2198 [Acidobacteriota bacterium]|jgi:hypothetical protein|nr:hypothetical protein [Acidobacteriota bacterium]